MKNENFINIQGWMIKKLKLKGTRLLIYALIYGFSQDEKSRFKGSMQYMADWVGTTRQGVILALNKLLEKKYIRRYETRVKGKKLYDFDINPDKIKDISYKESLQEDEPHVKKVDNSCKESLQETGKESLHPINTPDIYNNNITSAKAEEQKELIPIIQEPTQTTEIELVSRSPAKKRNRELTPDQKLLFQAAKACFEANGRTKAIMYQDKRSAQMSTENLKLFVVRCSSIAPEITADFMRNVLEHFKVLCNGKLKDKVTFTPRALITPWIWETVIDSLPVADDELMEKIRQSIRGMFK